jgi:hypothetical protein
MPFPKGDLVASIIAAGEKPSRTVIAADELLPQLTDEELEKVRLYIYALLSPAGKASASCNASCRSAVQALDGS